jgi:CHASE1-domain containing sensor protein
MTSESTITMDKVTRAEWIAVAAFTVTVLAQVFNMGVVYAQVQDHERRLLLEEGKSDAIIPLVQRIDERVQFLAEQAREQRAREVRK